MTQDGLFDLEPAHVPDLPKSSAVISDDGLYRYELRRTWAIDKPHMTFVMLNPSTADALQDDPTVRRCRGFAEREGCGTLRVLNLYAYRATKPQALWEAFSRGVDIVGPDNDRWLGSAAGRDDVVVAAWGAHGAPDRVREVRRILTERGHDVHALALTKAGAPGHPLYLPGDAPLIRWEG